MIKTWQKVAIAAPVVLLVAAAGYIATHSGWGVNRNNLPKFIQADFVDLSKIYSISKFRSGEGHDFSGGGETCRSMKHYFTPLYDPAADAYIYQHNGIPKPPDGSADDIAIFSPVDGTITDVGEEHTPIGKQISVVADKAPDFKIRLFHIYLKNGIGAGSHVTAGERIGSIGKNQGTDIAVQIGTLPWNEEYVSYFDVMPDSFFASYQKRGATSRSDFIFTREYRDAHPIRCQGEPDQKFIYPEGYDHTADDMHLSGYVQPNDKMPQHQNNGPQAQSNKPN
jgi:hypothetical protein